jgi:hypothetical protein
MVPTQSEPKIKYLPNMIFDFFAGFGRNPAKKKAQF